MKLNGDPASEWFGVDARRRAGVSSPRIAIAYMASVPVYGGSRGPDVSSIGVRFSEDPSESDGSAICSVVADISFTPLIVTHTSN